ncbi:hypothetical protein [Burkholderia ambifaria]|uniref:hypothetical protein n=1 Tax=Burkholderia ambifaria TaxID=152480 RepID=UPI001588731F|nr:hypothetical protein [Burkholderia ambifaria]
MTASAAGIEAATIPILAGGHLDHPLARDAEQVEQRGLVKAVAGTTFGFDVCRCITR